MTTFSNLKTDVELFLPHSDHTDIVIEKFITLAEAEIRRKVRVAAMITTDDAFSQSSQSTALPTGWLSFLAVCLDSEHGRRLDYMPPQRLRSSTLWDATGEPRAYTIEGQNIVVAPFTAATLHLVYYEAFTALSDANTSNWLSTNAYDVYLNGTLKYAARWAMDDANEAKYTVEFNQGITELNREQQRARFTHPLKATGGITP